MLLFPAYLALVGCSDGTSVADGVGKAAGQLANVRTTVAQQGTSGGFVDVNGDGIDDLVVCAPYATQGETLGLAFVYYGTTNGFSAEPKLVLSGGDNFGFAFATLGDVDGDGKGDFAISALHGGGDDVSLSGSVTVFKGGGNGTSIATIAGEAALDRFGYALAAGDLNGDGTKELVIGAPFHSPTPALYQQGAVYLYDFTTKALKAIKASATVQGLGSSVAAGNINGDTYDDLLVSTSTAYGVGNKVQVFHGRADLVANPGGPTLSLSSMAGSFGDSLRVIPDLNGDGFQELLIGASKAAVGSATEMGVLLVVKGTTQTGSLNLDSTPAALLQKITGQAAYDRFGSPAAAIGDLDNGGKTEVAVAAVHADNGSSLMTGKVYLLRGEDLAVGSAQLATAAVIGGPGNDMHFGRLLVPFTKNGPKLLVGAPTAFQNSGGVFGFNPADAKLLFQVSYGGLTTTSADCCK
jgi:hypothetical protein